jgi:hypothetical protein
MIYTYSEYGPKMDLEITAQLLGMKVATKHTQGFNIHDFFLEFLKEASSSTLLNTDLISKFSGRAAGTVYRILTS